MLVRRFFILFLLVIGMAGMAGTAFSQDVSGSFDGYYEFNINRPGFALPPFVAPQQNIFRAFDINHAKISLNYAEVVIEKKPAKFGYRFDLGIGDTARLVNAFEPNPSNNLQYLQQGYVSAKVSDQFQVDFGKFVTPMGAEVIETKDNWNYSRGFLFSYAIPFYHMGLRATVSSNEQMQFALFLVNGWNNVTDNNTAKTVGGQIILKSKNKKLTWAGTAMSGIEGPDGTTVRHTFDSILTYELNDRVSLMSNYDYGTDGNFAVAGKPAGKADWKGVAAYAKLAASKKLIVIPRYEWFNDVDGFATLAGGFPTPQDGQTLQEVTITAQVPMDEGKAKLWFEFRRDWNNSSTDFAIFPVKSSGESKAFQNTATIGLTYEFKK